MSHATTVKSRAREHDTFLRAILRPFTRMSPHVAQGNRVAYSYDAGCDQKTPTRCPIAECDDNILPDIDETDSDKL